MIKHDTIAKLGYEEKALAIRDNMSVSSKSDDYLGIENGTQGRKAIEYLNKGKDQKESVKDFIENARKILVS